MKFKTILRDLLVERKNIETREFKLSDGSMATGKLGRGGTNLHVRLDFIMESGEFRKEHVLEVLRQIRDGLTPTDYIDDTYLVYTFIEEIHFGDLMVVCDTVVEEVCFDPSSGVNLGAEEEYWLTDYPDVLMTLSPRVYTEVNRWKKKAGELVPLLSKKYDIGDYKLLFSLVNGRGDGSVMDGVVACEMLVTKELPEQVTNLLSKAGIYIIDDGDDYRP